MTEGPDTNDKMTLQKFLVGFWPIVAYSLSLGAISQIIEYQNIPGIFGILIYVTFSAWALYSVMNYK